MNELHDVIVVGGGLAGLTAAQYCRRAGLDVVVFDPHPGGRARTDERNGVLFNRGPHALYRGGAAERVLSELGVRYRGHAPLNNDGRGSFAGRTFGLPSSARSLATSKLLGLRGKAAFAKLLIGLPKIDPDKYADVSISDWIGDIDPTARALALAFTRLVTYSNSPESASAQVPIAALKSLGVLYLDGGWQTLVDQLRAGLDIRAESVISARSGGVVTTENSYEAASVIVAVAKPDAAAGILGRSPFATGPSIEAACLDLALSAAPEVPFVLGLDTPHYLSQHNPPARLVSGGSPRWVVHVARYLAAEDSASPADQRRELELHAAHAGIASAHITDARYLHRMTVTGAVVMAAHGGLAGRPAVDDSGHDDVYIAGDWVGAEGQLADAALASASVAAQRVMAKVSVRG
jgi:phytoene dehydrogenase-like protein